MVSYSSYTLLINKCTYCDLCIPNRILIKKDMGIVKNAKKVLESDEFEDISLQLLKEIIKRDPLQLSSGKEGGF